MHSYGNDMAQNKLYLTEDNINVCLESIKQSIENNWQVDESIFDQIPQPLAGALKSLLDKVHDCSVHTEKELKALGSANVRMLLLTEAISDWKMVDFDLHKAA